MQKYIFQFIIILITSPYVLASECDGHKELKEILKNPDTLMIMGEVSRYGHMSATKEEIVSRVEKSIGRKIRVQDFEPFPLSIVVTIEKLLAGKFDEKEIVLWCGGDTLLLEHEAEDFDIGDKIICIPTVSGLRYAKGETLYCLSICGEYVLVENDGVFVPKHPRESSGLPEHKGYSMEEILELIRVEPVAGGDATR